MPADDLSSDAGSPPRGAPSDDPDPDRSLVRLAEVVILLADDIHTAAIPIWEPLTGLQVLFLTTIARGGRVTRDDLRRDCRTSRAAVTPGLASLIHQGFVVETPDGTECVLTLGPAGRDLLARIDRARIEWMRHASARTRTSTPTASTDSSPPWSI